MKAVHVSAQSDGTYSAGPLAFPSVYRTGVGDPEVYRLRARGMAPPPTHQLTPCGPLRTICLKDGPVDDFASQPGALLTFVVSGQLRLALSGGATGLESGDMLLVDDGGVPAAAFTASDGCRLIQLGVQPDWPGDDGKDQGPGTAVARKGPPNIKRIYTGEDERSYFGEFADLFPAPAGEWAPAKIMEGFRFLSWEDGTLDWHPGVINQLGVFLSGEIEVEVGGGGGETQRFYAGDVCLCEDRTGEGHVDRVRGLSHVILLVIANEHLWSAARA